MDAKTKNVSWQGALTSRHHRHRSPRSELQQGPSHAEQSDSDRSEFLVPWQTAQRTAGWADLPTDELATRKVSRSCSCFGHSGHSTADCASCGTECSSL